MGFRFSLAHHYIDIYANENKYNHVNEKCYLDMNLNIPNSLFMHAHVLPGKYLEMYLKFNDCRHYIQAFIYNPL